jgi:hypothetical protein
LLTDVIVKLSGDPSTFLLLCLNQPAVHGLPAFRRVRGNKWLDIAMIRVNHKGTRMDAEDYNTDGLGNVTEVVAHVKQIRKEGMGVVSMKLVGKGTFNREDRKAAMRSRLRTPASIALQLVTRTLRRSTRRSRI